MLARSILTTLLIAVLLLAPATSLLARSYLLSVGIDQYDPFLGADPLSCCVNDANGVFSAAANYPDIWGYCELLVNSQATEDYIRTRIQTLSTVLVEGDVFWYYQSSHGGSTVTTPTSYAMTCYDDDYFDYALAHDLSLFNPGVRIVVVVDACNSGGLFKGAEPARSFDFGCSVLSHLARMRGVKTSMPANVGFITACDADQESREGTTFGLFTNHFLGAFSRGDANADGQVTFQEAYEYAGPLAYQEALAYGVPDPQVAQADNSPVLDTVVMREYVLSDLVKELPSGCAINAAATVASGLPLYVPLILVMTAALTTKLRRRRTASNGRA